MVTYLYFFICDVLSIYKERIDRHQVLYILLAETFLSIHLGVVTTLFLAFVIETHSAWHLEQKHFILL